MEAPELSIQDHARKLESDPLSLAGLTEKEDRLSTFSPWAQNQDRPEADMDSRPESDEPGIGNRNSGKQSSATVTDEERRFDPVEKREVDAPLRILPSVNTSQGQRKEMPTLLMQHAESRVQHGYDLGRRGAVYSAKGEFVRALQLVARGYDESDHTTIHTIALERALMALSESDDFADGDANFVGKRVDVRAIVATHQTPVLRGGEEDPVTALDALQRYFQYAKEQLVVAGENAPVASTAIQGLARVETALFRKDQSAGSYGGPKAICLYQTAVLVDPQNHKAANELGVLLASFGQLQQAQRALSNSLSVHPDPIAWHNLSVVYERLGESQLSQQAREQSRILADTRTNSGMQPQGRLDQDTTIRWVDLNTFTDFPAAGPSVASRPKTQSNRSGSDQRQSTAAESEAKPASKWSTLPGIFSVWNRGSKPDRSAQQKGTTSREIR